MKRSQGQPLEKRNIDTEGSEDTDRDNNLQPEELEGEQTFDEEIKKYEDEDYD